MFRRMLIANRGEIAVRIVRACRDRGITSVLMCAEVDRESLAARLADEVHEIAQKGPSPRDVYLDVGGIIDVARVTRCDALHPGYGFLSENPEFSSACRDAGVTFVGPGPEQIQLLGNKNAARSQMARHGVPVVPGSESPLKNVDEALAEAHRIGYPVLLKASMGGGGRGMRHVTAPEQLIDAFSSARSEARLAFGLDDIYLERYIARPRHVEVQVAADADGHAVHLFERECSIQRRFQKMIEEAPSPAINEETRHRMGEAAVRGASSIGYQNLGTFEFLVDEQRNFYFLEVNTRLQVEHPVTEEITGVDLVSLQIDLAAGRPLPFRQSDLTWSGWSFEARITCEDPYHNFVPEPGRVQCLELPQGPGVRLDGCIYPGSIVLPHFDSLMAKLIVRGATREEARLRMLRALDELVIIGPPTTIPFHRWAFSSPAFASGDLSTHFLEENDWAGHANAHRSNGVAPDIARLAAALAALGVPSAVTGIGADQDTAARQWRLASRDW